MQKIDEGEKIAWQLFEDNNGIYIFSVLCGSIGMYERKIELDEDEADEYKKSGKKILDDLAYKISKNENAFLRRFI